MIIPSPFDDISIPENVDLTTFILDKAHLYGDRTAIVDGFTDKSKTYKELLEEVTSCALSLRVHGVKQKDVILMCSPNCVEFPVLLLGALRLGAVVSTANPLYTAGEIKKQAQLSGAAYVFVHEESTQKLEAAVAGLDKIQKMFVIGQSKHHTTLADLLQHPPDHNALPKLIINSREDVAFIPFSSGTTGVPKGVMLTHLNIISNICQHCHPSLLPIPRGQEVILGLPPWFHSYGLVVTLCFGLFRASKVVVIRRFHPESYLRAIEKYKATLLHVVPPILVTLSKSALATRCDLSSVDLVWSGAAPLAKGVAQECKEKLGLSRVGQGWGLTETSPGVTLWPRREMPMESSGVLIPNTQAKIVDPETGKELGLNQLGEVAIRGPQVMKGYLNNTEATDRMIDSDGWLHTGDIGYFDDQLNCYIVDRVKELIKYKGNQVAPAEMEAVILTHPEVADAAVIGIPDYEAGELPFACVVLKQGSALKAATLQNYVAERVAPHKKLRGGVEIVSEIPKSPSGKILRRILRDQYMKRLSSKL